MRKLLIRSFFTILTKAFRNRLVRHIAHAEGFPDPLLVLANLKRFAQPSELIAPKELLRAGAIMQIRGLINSQAIQHNMDWIWPFWIERQFDPGDESFTPRAFNLTHLNLTHRNWTAVGVPDFTELSIVDPRGLVTPFYDGWSIDTWIVKDKDHQLIPARLLVSHQEWSLRGNPEVITTSENETMRLISRAEAYEQDGVMICRMKLTAQSLTGGWLVCSLRPCNPEGISFLNKISLFENHKGWKVNDRDYVHFDHKPERTRLSHYWNGDVFGWMDAGDTLESVNCPVGMATGAVLFELRPNISREVMLSIPVAPDTEILPEAAPLQPTLARWGANLLGLCEAKLPDPHFKFLYDAAIRSLILHSPHHDIYPGPYTYKRFWFRDAAFILDAMLCVGMVTRAQRVIDHFPSRQNSAGYFLSQDGEWDSNGEALFAMKRFCERTGRKADLKWKKSIYRGAKWIQNKREYHQGGRTFGLLPVGFSAEHLGPNDYYYWDDFWGVEGLRAASFFARQWGDSELAERFANQSNDLMRCVEASLKSASDRTNQIGMPASPYRRMDAGAVGSLAAGYPLQLMPARDARLIRTAEYLFQECFVQGGFYQEISHSGINIYLTLHIAQVFLRAGDPRYFDLMKSVAGLASPTGQWPEAIHPRTKGGCMGDGQHIWAAAEWILMIRNCFVREEEGKIILGSGVPEWWISEGREASLGPTPTSFGPITVWFKSDNDNIQIEWVSEWNSETNPAVEIHLPGFAPVSVNTGEKKLFISKLHGRQ